MGAGKIQDFAEEAGATVDVEVADITTYESSGHYDIVICNGVLHYIGDKRPVVERMQAATRPGGINVISLWSTHTPVPDCHRQVPVYCNDEDGLVTGLYAGWVEEVLAFQRDKPETSHSGMTPHTHSHIKLIARKP